MNSRFTSMESRFIEMAYRDDYFKIHPEHIYYLSHLNGYQELFDERGVDISSAADYVEFIDNHKVIYLQANIEYNIMFPDEVTSRLDEANLIKTMLKNFFEGQRYFTLSPEVTLELEIGDVENDLYYLATRPDRITDDSLTFDAYRMMDLGLIDTMSVIFVPKSGDALNFILDAEDVYHFLEDSANENAVVFLNDHTDNHIYLKHGDNDEAFNAHKRFLQGNPIEYLTISYSDMSSFFYGG